MKKFTLFILTLVSLTAKAEVYTLDLNSPTYPEEIIYSEDGMWNQTGVAHASNMDNFFKFQVFNFSHNVHNVYSTNVREQWTGFTVCKSTYQNDYCANYAQGGLAGTDSPYIWAKYSHYWHYEDNNNRYGTSTNYIRFESESVRWDRKHYYPKHLYLNISQEAYKDIMGEGFVARAFAQGDELKVKICALDSTGFPDTTNYVYGYLADFRSENSSEWTIATDWVKVDLTSLGKCYGLSFEVISTDIDPDFGMLTSTLFALDGLTVVTTAEELITTGISSTRTNDQTEKVLTPEGIWIIRGGKTYSVTGNLIK